MTSNVLRHTVYSLLLAMVLTSFCNGQHKDKPDQINRSEIFSPATLPKLVKSQGSNEHDNVHAMLQDRHGGLWFATTGEGVYRYDGKVFMQFTQTDGLSSNTVYSMLEDSSGNIWFGTKKGISRFDGKSISSVSISDANGRNFLSLLNTSNSPADMNEVSSIMQDMTGIIWFGTTEGLYCYNGTGFSRLLNNFKMINNEGLKLRSIQCMLQDRNGIIWLGSGMGEIEGLCRYDARTITSVKPKIDGWIRQMLQDKKGTVWLSTRSQGLWRDDGSGFARFSVQDDRVTGLLQCNQAMMQDRLGNIWFGGSETVGTVETNSGIWRYDGTNFKNYTAKDGLGVYGVWSMLEDSAGQIWVGTRNTGLYRFDGSRFTSFSD